MKALMLGNDTREEVEKRLQIVASAGNLSRADGTVTKVVESNNDYEKNLKLARAVIGYGHKSIAQHDYLVFALEDVTPIVELTLIGYRLTSFTIKSRRNVDFRNAGFYTPDFKDKDGNILDNNEELKNTYNNYMQSLFNKYGDFVDEELPVEDSRYILPYSYHSNIIMGCDANEFLNMTCDLLYGKPSKITELKELGLKFKELILKYAPYLSKALEKEENKDYYEDKLEFLDDKVNIENEELLDDVHLVDYSRDGDNSILCSAIMNRYDISASEANKVLYSLAMENEDILNKMMDAILSKKNQRELEQIMYKFEFPISLAVLTHITRHRMHSLMVPDFAPLNNLENYVIPETIAKNHEEEYKEIFANNKIMVDYFKEQGVRDEDLVYFYLSGNALNVSTTMNARTLKWISRMRCCNKAQWEIRDIVNKMVLYAKEVTPLVSRGYGAYCTVEGYCPEGKDSCKNRGVVVKKKEKK